MLPNLVAATHDYWKKLDRLEAAYQNGEVSLEEVDARVAELMTELAAERRATFRLFGQSFWYWLNSQREVVVGIVVAVIAIYLWLTTGV